MRRAVERLRALVRRDQRGSVSVLAAALGTCLIASLAISIDVGSIYLTRRDNQGALDIAAMTAARNLAAAEPTARTSLRDNGVKSMEGLKVTLGRYTADASASSTARFVAGGQPTNAVRLEMTTRARLFFGRSILGDAPTVATTSTAVNTKMGSFSVGSRLASLQGGVANALLSALLGGSVSLSVMDYNALADAKIEMPTLLRSVASRARITALTYDDVLKSTVTVRDVANALGDGAASSGAKFSLQKIAGAAASDRQVSLARMISFGPLGTARLQDDVGTTATASLLQTLMIALSVANGDRQIDLDVGAQVPGVLALTAQLLVGERPQSSPWFAIDREGASVHTAQTRLRLAAKVGGALGIASINLPIAIDLAAAEATFATAQCGAVPRDDARSTLSVEPALARAWVGEPRDPAKWNDMTKAADVVPATIVDTLLLAATASSYVGAENITPTTVAFSASEMRAGTVKTVSTTTIAQSTLTSLTRNARLSVTLKGLGITLGTPQFVSDALAAVVAPVGALIDPVLNSLCQILGLGFGQADVTMRGLRCDGSALVG